MQTPLLALTLRRRPAPPPDGVGAENMRQLIQLRWLAVLGQFVTIVTVRFGLGVQLPTEALLGVVLLLAVVNLAGLFLLGHRHVSNAEFLFALLFDVGMLTAQLFLSGGADNPFIALYLVQIVLGAILLTAGLVWVLVAVTTGCYAFLTTQHRSLVFPPDLQRDVANLYTLCHWLSFAIVAMLLVMFIARISRNLRARDTYLADMRQHAAEEDNIVRMGLFASGAAHELGTPLASLAVILSDWQRMPGLAGDAELAADLQDMQSEVQRCKSIVTDILHSAGEPRSEALGSIDASALVEDLALAWHAAHPTVPLECRCTRISGVAVVADLALRQAVWNLLENAAEVSPGQLHLAAMLEDGMLVLAVRDHGPGLAASVVSHFGQPVQSTKGEGHGLGLFLVATVMRRLGGRVEPVNLAQGGAEIRLFVPISRKLPANV